MLLLYTEDERDGYGIEQCRVIRQPPYVERHQSRCLRFLLLSVFVRLGVQALTREWLMFCIYVKCLILPCINEFVILWNIKQIHFHIGYKQYSRGIP